MSLFGKLTNRDAEGGEKREHIVDVGKVRDFMEGHRGICQQGGGKLRQNGVLGALDVDLAA